MTDRVPADFIVEAELTEEGGRYRMTSPENARTVTDEVRDLLGVECLKRMAEGSCHGCQADLVRSIFEVRGETIEQVGTQCANGHSFLARSILERCGDGAVRE